MVSGYWTKNDRKLLPLTRYIKNCADTTEINGCGSLQTLLWAESEVHRNPARHHTINSCASPSINKEREIMTKANHRKNSFLLVVIMFMLSLNNCTTVHHLSNNGQKLKGNYIEHLQIKSDTLFNSKQIINILIIPKMALNKFPITIGYCDHCLMKTSLIAKNHNAIAGINGGFFDEDAGGSVNYVEINDLVINTTQYDNSKWSKPDSLANGALILYGTDSIKIETAKKDLFYEQSKSESAVLVAGPLLIKDSQPQRLPNMSFATERHPRTCFCITDKSILLLTIDGRNENAAGMSLFEVQRFLSTLSCTDAINLDGGGSSTMWTKDKGIVNHPSDKEGERQVANALLILKN